MKISDFTIRLEEPSDDAIVDQMAVDVFGPQLFERAAYHLREGVDAEPHLCFVAECDGAIVGTVRVTKIRWGNDQVLMLGPLVVLPEFEGHGIGRALMKKAVSVAREAVSAGQPNCMILVGDLSYYQPFGFKRIPHGQITLPKPADPDRILVCEFKEGCSAHRVGAARRFVP